MMTDTQSLEDFQSLLDKSLDKVTKRLSGVYLRGRVGTSESLAGLESIKRLAARTHQFYLDIDDIKKNNEESARKLDQERKAVEPIREDLNRQLKTVEKEREEFKKETRHQLKKDQDQLKKDQNQLRKDQERLKKDQEKLDQQKKDSKSVSQPFLSNIILIFVVTNT